VGEAATVGACTCAAQEGEHARGCLGAWVSRRAGEQASASGHLGTVLEAHPRAPVERKRCLEAGARPLPTLEENGFRSKCWV
jgi:hypothetical protein